MPGVAAAKPCASDPLDGDVTTPVGSGRCGRRHGVVWDDPTRLDAIDRMSASAPLRLVSPSGLTVHLNANGSVRRIDCGDVTVNAFLGNELEGGPANLYLRRHGARVEWTPLLGPRSPGAVRLESQALHVDGEWAGIRFHVSLVLA